LTAPACRPARVHGEEKVQTTKARKRRGESRSGKKIPRPVTAVPVRFRSRAPYPPLISSS